MRWSPLPTPTVPYSMPVSHSASAHGRRHALHLLGPRVGGEVEVGAEPAQQRVAHTAADEVQLVARVSEHPAEIAQHVGVPVQRHLGSGEQFSVVGHVQ